MGSSVPPSTSNRLASTSNRLASTSNRLGLDYRSAAARLNRPRLPLVDVHAHINGAGAARIYAEVAQAYGVTLTYSQTQPQHAPGVRAVLGERVRFVAVPNWGGPEPEHAWRAGFLDNIRLFHGEFGARMIKLWNGPRLRDRFPGASGADCVPFDSPWRVKAAELAQKLGMAIMVHVADPDTWFASQYKDASKYGTKLDQYPALENMLNRFPGPWIAAHMGGFPENLEFLDGMLERHQNLHLDTSAAKWVVRELSKHEPARLREFFRRWRGRILFGSDIVTSDDHLSPQKVDPKHPKADQADSPETAFDLYASRYWSLRALLESDYDGESPIADPDLKMLEPARYDDMSAPRLRGAGLSPDLLDEIYFGTARRFFARLDPI